MSETNSFRSQELTADPSPASGEATPNILESPGHALSERLGVGGMGEVYRFGDEALQRDLAIKILREELSGNADAEERFLREARLTGSLQHPGVVPIHNLSRLADGRPCYTMKLVRGRTFADMLRDEPQGPERLPRLLAILEKVCQAVAYAHSKHVIHRDLKPSNVMVGEFGEVQVMDWGLAKELSRSEPEPPPEETEDVETAAWTKEADGLSRAGSALGTPAYMPPEQAAGDWDIVDERADVFALGAILCEMLIGYPPYHGANREDLLRRARRHGRGAGPAGEMRCGCGVGLFVPRMLGGGAFAASGQCRRGGRAVGLVSGGGARTAAASRIAARAGGGQGSGGTQAASIVGSDGVGSSDVDGGRRGGMVAVATAAGQDEWCGRVGAG